MTSVEDVVGSLNADLDALQEIQARIEEARAEAEELFAGLQTAGAQAAANAVGAAKEQLMTAALAISPYRNKQFRSVRLWSISTD